MFRSLMSIAVILNACVTIGSGSIQVVDSGVAQSVVVTSDEAYPVARYAAKELVEHVRKATGVELRVVTESELEELAEQVNHRIFIGDTAAARRHGMDPDLLAADVYVMRTVGGDLFIVAKEDADDPVGHYVLPHRYRLVRDKPLYSGTLFGVYELLERYVGVRWLWPGDLGTYVPRTDVLVIEAPIHEEVGPALGFRHVRWDGIWRAVLGQWAPGHRGGSAYAPAMAEMAMSHEGLARYGYDLHHYMRRHRMGFTEEHPRPGHLFARWWERYGQEHPEWFMLNSSGQRGSETGHPRHTAMCVSNPDLHAYLVHEHWDGKSLIRLGESDHVNFCHCENCLAWDEPLPDAARAPAGARDFYNPRATSNRYARFWKAVYEKAVERNPQAKVSTFLYFNYFSAPHGDIPLNENIYGEFCPWGSQDATYFPMGPAELQWLKDQWRHWRDTGISMVFRPNHLLAGYAMPYLDLYQGGDFFRFAFEHGMHGTDFDSLTGQWAVQGPGIYVQMRLHTKPRKTVDAILQEYYDAFGPASEEVKAYFTYWDRYANRLVHEGRMNRLRRPNGSHGLFPRESFKPAWRLLEEAARAASHADRDEYANRVAFLGIGLRHAELVSQLSEILADPRDLGDQAYLAEARAVLTALIDYRRAHEHTYMADYGYLVEREHRFWGESLAVLLGHREHAGLEESHLSPLHADWGSWRFRKDVEDRGVEEQWYVPPLDDPAWSPIAVPGNWMDTIGQYYGYGWYSTSFVLPEEYPDDTVALWFGGVDEQAWVFVNGRLVGEHTTASEGIDIGGLWDRPFTVKVPVDLLHAGQPNTLAVRVHATVGQAGIWRPVRLYASEND